MYYYGYLVTGWGANPGSGYGPYRIVYLYGGRERLARLGSRVLIVAVSLPAGIWWAGFYGVTGRE